MGTTQRFRRLLCVASLTLSAMSPAAGQTIFSESVPDLLKNARSLSPNDVVRVLQASKAAVAGKTLRLTPTLGTPIGPEILMGADGRMALVRTVTGTGTSRRPPNEEPTQIILTTTLTEYTRQPARYCDGTPASGELVIDYTSSVGGATVIARYTNPLGEPLSPIFEIFAGSLTATDAGRKLLANRWARGFTAPWNPPAIDVEEKLPDGRTSRFQRPGPKTELVAMFWIDEASLEPLRFEFEITIPESARRDSPGLPGTMPYGFWFEYDATLDIRRPEGMPTPTCIDPHFMSPFPR